MNSKARILVVDDDPDLLNINSSILQSSGLEVIEAGTGNECISMAREMLPDVILLDVNLPDTNGFDVCKQIKADPLLANTYVILISGVEISSESKVYGLDLGADEYIVRPISGRELLARVKAMIRLKDAEIALRKSKEQYRTLNEELERRVVDRTMQLEAVVNELESEIIERKHIEEDLRIKGIAIASSINAIAFADLEGTLTYVNNAFLQLWGYDTERDILNKPIMFCWQDRGKAGKVMEDLSARGWCMGAMVGRREDGSTFDAQFSANVVSDANGIPLCLEASFIDITERKKTEEAMVQYAERLQALSARLLDVQESERPYIAQELHDEIGEVLTGLSLSLEHIVGALPSDDRVWKMKAQARLDVTTIREELCRNFCPYYKPSKDEELACLGFTVIERLIGKGWTIPFDTPDHGCEERTKGMLLEVLCTACPFFENDCDFVTGSSHSPCGGFTLLGCLLDRQVIHIDDIKNII